MRPEGSVSNITGAGQRIALTAHGVLTGGRDVRCKAILPLSIAIPALKAAPGKVIAQLTERALMKRFGRLEQAADADACLASDLPSGVHGAVSEVSGGLTV